MKKRTLPAVILALLIAVLASAPADAGIGSNLFVGEGVPSGAGQAGLIALPAGDLSGSGSTNANPTISNITGSGGGTVTTSPTLVALSEQGTGPANGTANGFTWTTQAVNATNGNAGNVAFNMPSPTGSGSHGTLQMQEAGTTYANLGRNPTGGTQGFFWLGSAAPATNNYTIVSDGSTVTFFNAVTVIDFAIANSVQAMSQTANGLQLFSFTTSFGGGTNVVGWTNAGTNPTSNPSGGSVCYSDASGGAFSEMTCRSPAGIIDEFAATGAGTHNSQAGRLRTRAYYVETTTSAGVSVTASDVTVASSTCEQYQVSWVGRNAAAGLGTSNVSSSLCCNNAGTLTCGTSANTYASNVNTSGTLCTTSVATFAFGVSGTHPTFTVTCPQTSPVTVDWQLSLQGNVD